MSIITRPVFVIGTGRSGTRWLGYSLGRHPEVRATIEVRPMFELSTRMALDPSLEQKLFGTLQLAYEQQIFKSTCPIYLDKSHPNIWIAGKLKKAFPDALFVGIERNPYATVASMIRDKDVSAWHKRWREFPIPNRFLGITAELAASYDSIPLPAQCSIRWLAHHRRMEVLEKTLGHDLLVIEYEKLVCCTREVLGQLQRFLQLSSPIPLPEVKPESVDRWRTQLNKRELEQIQGAIEGSEK